MPNHLDELESSGFFKNQIRGGLKFIESFWASLSNFFVRVFFGKPHSNHSSKAETLVRATVPHESFISSSYDALMHQMSFEKFGFVLLDEGQQVSFDPLSQKYFDSAEQHLHYVSAKRHQSPSLQRLYDQNFGLVPYQPQKSSNEHANDNVSANTVNFFSSTPVKFWSEFFCVMFLASLASKILGLSDPNIFNPRMG